MAISKQRIYYKSGTGPRDYRIVHLETSSDIVQRPNSEMNVEETLARLEGLVNDIQNGIILPDENDTGVKSITEAIMQINNRFTAAGILRPNYGGTGTAYGQAPSAAKLYSKRFFCVDLDSTDAAEFDGTDDAVLGVAGVLPVEKGGTGETTLENVLGTLIKGCSELSAAGIETFSEEDKIPVLIGDDKSAKYVTIGALISYLDEIYFKKVTLPQYLYQGDITFQ